MIGFTSSTISVLDHAELSITAADDSSLVHMDVDLSFFPIPSPVKAAIFESFSRQNVAESEIDVTTSIRQFIKSNYGFPTSNNAEFVYADFPLPLFNKLACPLLHPRRWNFVLPSWLKRALRFCCQISESKHCDHPYPI